MPHGVIAQLTLDVTAALSSSGTAAQHVLQLWSAEQPSLYLLLLKLSAGGTLLEVEGCQVRPGLLEWSRAACMLRQTAVHEG